MRCETIYRGGDDTTGEMQPSQGSQAAAKSKLSIKKYS